MGLARPIRRARRANRRGFPNDSRYSRMTCVSASCSQVLQQVVARDVGLVADADEGRQADAAVRRQVEDGETEGAALGREADVSRGRQQRREGRVQSDSRRGVDEAHAVRSDHPQAQVPHPRHQPVLKGAPLVARLGEPGRDHDQRADPGGGQVVDDAQDGGRRNGDDRQVDASRQRPGARQTGDAVDVGRLGVHRVDGTHEAALADGVEDAPADVSRIAGRAHHGHRAWLEHRLQGGDRRDAIPHFRRSDALGRRRDGELQLEAPGVGLGADQEAGLAEDLQHRRVLGEGGRPEARDAAGNGQHRQALEQRRAEPVPLEAVAHRKGDLRRLRAHQRVGRHGDGPQLPVDLT